MSFNFFRIRAFTLPPQGPEAHLEIIPDALGFILSYPEVFALLSLEDPESAAQLWQLAVQQLAEEPLMVVYKQVNNEEENALLFWVKHTEAPQKKPWPFKLRKKNAIRSEARRVPLYQKPLYREVKPSNMRGRKRMLKKLDHHLQRVLSQSILRWELHKALKKKPTDE